jgi:hypothetical protein
VTSKNAVDSGPAKLVFSGGHVVHQPWVKEAPKMEFDAFYCHVGCADGRVPSYNLRVAAEKDGWDSESLRRSPLTADAERP